MDTDKILRLVVELEAIADALPELPLAAGELRLIADRIRCATTVAAAPDLMPDAGAHQLGGWVISCDA